MLKLSMPSTPTWTPIATTDELWEGEIAEFYAGDHAILLAHLRSGAIRAYDGRCPHAGFPLADGELIGDVLVCAAHSWEFDLTTGNGVNPDNCRLQSYPVRCHDDRIMVWLNENSTQNGEQR
jgi:toluene monooxygenase system ferredoxin subunit